MTDLNRKPAYNIVRICKLRDKLANETMLEFHGLTLTGYVFETFVDQVGKAAGVEYGPLYHTLRYIAGKRLTARLAFDTAWCIAGNISTLRAGNICVFSAIKREWVPLYVCNIVRPAAHENTKDGVYATLLVLAGPCCTRKTVQYWSRSFCYALARRIGFTSPRGGYYLQNPEDLKNMYMLGLIDDIKSDVSKLVFKEYGITPGLRKRNKKRLHKLVEARAANVTFCNDV